MARYRIVPERSSVRIAARSTLHPLTVAADGLEGWFDLGPEPGGRLRLAVERLSCGSRFEDRELRRRIDARRFPSIDGVLTGAERPDDDGGVYRVSGNITFHGVTRSYKDEMCVEAIDATTVRMAGRAQFDLRDFGMTPPRVLFVRVEPQVDVAVEIVAEQEEEG